MTDHFWKQRPLSTDRPVSFLWTSTFDQKSDNCTWLIASCLQKKVTVKFLFLTVSLTIAWLRMEFFSNFFELDEFPFDYFRWFFSWEDYCYDYSHDFCSIFLFHHLVRVSKLHWTGDLTWICIAGLSMNWVDHSL